jgi:hypothetical protein
LPPSRRKHTFHLQSQTLFNAINFLYFDSKELILAEQSSISDASNPAKITHFSSLSLEHFFVCIYLYRIRIENNHLEAGLDCRVVTELVEAIVLHRDLNIP